MTEIHLCIPEPVYIQVKRTLRHRYNQLTCSDQTQVIGFVPSGKASLVGLHLYRSTYKDFPNSYYKYFYFDYLLIFQLNQILEWCFLHEFSLKWTMKNFHGRCWVQISSSETYMYTDISKNFALPNFWQLMYFACNGRDLPKIYLNFWKVISLMLALIALNKPLLKF